MSEITVVEDYCIACQGTCTRTDPDDYEHMYYEWERLLDLWVQRDVDPPDHLGLPGVDCLVMRQGLGVLLGRSQGGPPRRLDAGLSGGR